MTRKVVSPIALDKSINTTEQTPRNIADVLAQQLAAIKTAIETGNGNLEAAFVCYYGVTTATQIKEAIEDGKVPYFYYNGVVAQLWKVETDKYTFRTTNTRSVEGQTILDVVDYVVNGSVWSTVTREVSGGSSSGQSYIASVNSLADFDTTGKSGMQDLVSVSNVPADGVYQVSVMLHITPKTASATKSDLVLQFTSSDNTGWPNHTFHAVVDDSQTFAQQLSFSTSVSLKAGQNTLRIQCGGLNTEYLVFVDDLTVAQLVNGVYHNGDDFADVHTLTEAADFNNDDGVLVDGATGGPRFMLWQTLANKILGFIKSLSTTITAFRTGDVIPVDGPSGTAKMSKDSLLAITTIDAINSTIVVGLESGTYQDPNGKVKVSNNTRLRNISPILVFNGQKIAIESPYQFYPFYLNSSMTLLGHGNWQSEISSDGLPSGTAYINFSIRNSLTPSADISGEVATAEAGITITTATLRAIGSRIDGVDAKIDESVNDIEVVQNLTHSEATIADGFPTISGGKITGYGAQTWWKHAIIDKDKGLFVDFDTTTGTNDYIWYIDDNGVILGKYSIPSPSVAILRKIPLNFTVGATKAVVVSSNLGGKPYGMKIYVWKYVGASEERKFTLDSLKMLPMKATPQVVADGYPTFDTLGGHTGYGTETYWSHAEINAGKGKFVSFYNGSSATYIHYLDSDGVRVASEVLAGSLGFIDKHPLNFPINSAKAIVMSANYPSGRGEVVLHELCDVDKVNDAVYATIDSLNPDLEPVDVQNDNGYVSRSGGYFTGFGEQTYWKHVTITKQEGLFVNFNVNSSNVPAITYVDDSEKIIKEELFTGNNTKVFVNIPLNFPEASTKCYVQSLYGAKMYQEVKVFKARKAYLPSYWNDAIESYAHAISEETRKIENGCAFIFITDLHFGQYNENHAGRIINKLLEKTSVPFAISGGDYIYAVGDDVDEFEKELALTRKFIGDVGKDNLFQVRGNHDFLIHYGTSVSPDGAVLAKAGTNDFLLSNLRADAVIDKAHTCYYYDHKYSNTRFIFVNSCDDYVVSDNYTSVTDMAYIITNEQLSFIADAVEGADGKHVVVVSHIAADPALSDYHITQLPVHNLLVSAKNHTTFSSGSITKDFTNWTGTIVMQVSGHAHKDEDAFTDGILSVLTDCDSRLHVGTREQNTIREHCFDVFIADYDNSKVKAIRIGAGSDREFTF